MPSESEPCIPVRAGALARGTCLDESDVEHTPYPRQYKEHCLHFPSREGMLLPVQASTHAHRGVLSAN